jgi:hypothetical protein
LTEIERKLLYDNEGCLKCRRVFVGHRSTTCPNDFPDPTTYKPITQTSIDAMTRRPKRNVIAAVIAPTEPASPSALPVAVVMGASRNPVAYMLSNPSNILEGDSNDSDSSVSKSHVVSMSPELAPLTVPHLFWQCSVDGPATTFPVTFEALIDHGSHTVLISRDLISKLGLRIRKLHKLMVVEMAIPNESVKQRICLTEWVKLSLYDTSGQWTSKTVRAVVAPSLCAPVILGLPFLSHNNIVIDHAARTVIDKMTGFDLLHPPVVVNRTLKADLKEFFKNLGRDRALLLMELKLACKERLDHTLFKHEPIAPFDALAALRERIETLTAVEQLAALSDAVKRKYRPVFNNIPC